MVAVRPLLLQLPAVTSLGVVGVVLNHAPFQTTTETNTTVYYLDENGYIVASTGQTSNTSFAGEGYRFFGAEQPIIFGDLVWRGVYRNASVVGYGTKVCPNGDMTTPLSGTCSASMTDCCATLSLCVSRVPFYTVQPDCNISGNFTVKQL